MTKDINKELQKWLYKWLKTNKQSGLSGTGEGGEGGGEIYYQLKLIQLASASASIAVFWNRCFKKGPGLTASLNVGLYWRHFPVNVFEYS